jgi:hypothetical protein
MNTIKRLYYVANPESIDIIRKKGIEANQDGYINFITDLTMKESLFGTVGNIPDMISYFHLFSETYYLIEINYKGIKGNIKLDNVTECTTFAQRKVKQNFIDLNYLKIMEERKVDVPKTLIFKEFWRMALSTFIQHNWNWSKVQQLETKNQLPYVLSEQILKDVKERIQVQYNITVNF